MPAQVPEDGLTWARAKLSPSFSFRETLIVYEDLGLAGFARSGGLSQTDDFHSSVIELEVLDQVIADHLRPSLSQHSILVGIADFGRGGHDGQTKFGLFHEFSRLVDGLFILEFRIV